MRVLCWKVVSLIAAIALVAAPARGTSNWCAQTHTPKNYPPVDPDTRCDPPCKCTNSPCYIGLGVYAKSAQDLNVRSAAGFPLVASRSYLSSQIADGPMGYGWMPSVVSRLSYSTYQYSAGTYQKRAYVLLPDGARLAFVENSNGSYTPPVGRRDTLVRNADGSWDLTLQHTLSVLHFNSTGYLTQMKDDYGNILSLTYNAAGNHVEQVADQAGSGRYLTIAWGADGRVASVSDSSGRSVVYRYDGPLPGTLHSLTDPLGHVTTYDYEQRRFSPQLISETDTWGRPVSAASYEPGTDRVLTYSEKGETYTLEYGYGGNPLAIRKRGASFPVDQWYEYNVDQGSGLINSFNDTSGTQSTTYNPDGSVALITDRVGVYTMFEYNPNGTVKRITRNATPQYGGSPVLFDYTYDVTFPEKVKTIKVKKPDGSTLDTDWVWWQYDYYTAGINGGVPSALQAVRRNGSAPALAVYEYDSKGRVTKYTEAVGTVTQYAYDPQGNLWTVTLSANNNTGTRQIVYSYDTLGRMLTSTDPLGKVTTYTYDALDRVATVTLPLVATTTGSFTTTYSYDQFDAPSQLLYTDVTDPNGVTTQQGFDQWGQLNIQTDGLGHSTSYEYLRGLLSSVTDANGYQTSYAYDGAGHLITTTFPDSSTETYAYKADGLLQSVSRGGVQTDYSYDQLKRVVTRAHHGANDRFTYVFTGQKLTQVDEYNASGVDVERHVLDYDTALRLKTVTLTAGSGSRGTIGYVWRNDDRLQSYTVDGAATPTATYAYYTDGSLKTITWVPASPSPSYVFTYVYDLGGRTTQIAYPSAYGQHRDYAYDEQGRLLSIISKTSANANIATYSYGYDKNQTSGAWDRKGQRTSMTAAVPSMSASDGTYKYDYDSLYQLTKVTPPAGLASAWTYDNVGNRITDSNGSLTATYQYQTIAPLSTNWQQLKNDGVFGHTWTYDGRGNVATQVGTGGTTQFTYDWENHLTTLGPPGHSYVYDYDYQGRRVSKTIDGTKTSYLYDGLNFIREKSGSSLTYAADYLYGPGVDEPLAMKRGSFVYFYFVDGMGSVRLVTDTSSNAQDKYSWDAWGKLPGTTPLVANPLGYTGREIGDNQDLYYRARYYYPQIGRFLAEDPSRLASGDANLYRYVQNRPMQFRDPSGLVMVHDPCRECLNRARQRYDWDQRRCDDQYADCLAACDSANACKFPNLPDSGRAVCIVGCVIDWARCTVGAAAAYNADVFICRQTSCSVRMMRRDLR